MWLSFGPGIGARDVIGIVAVVVDEFQFRKRLSVNVSFRPGVVLRSICSAIDRLHK